MSWHNRILNLFRSDRHSADLDREMAFHVAELADRLEASGIPRGEAEEEARRRFGNRGQIKEQARDVDILPWLDTLATDARYALRDLFAHPGFTAVAVLSLALGIGANTAIFGLIDSVMLRSLPVRAPDELVAVTMGGGERDVFTNPLWEAIRDQPNGFAGALAFSSTSFDRSSGGEAKRIDGAWVSGRFFSTLGVRPAAGRLLTAADDRRGCAPVAVLGGTLWSREFASDPGVVGKLISLDGHAFTIVGVADPAFFGLEVGRRTQVYAPLCAVAVTEGSPQGLDARSHWWLSIMARRAPGEDLTTTKARLGALAPRVYEATLPQDWDASQQADYLRNTLDVVPGATGLSELRATYRRALFTVMAVVGIVLLVACANVANLLLARGRRRRRELAIRLALGAGRGRLVRQLLTESLLLAFVGAALGVVFAKWGSALLVSYLVTREGAVWLDLSLSGRVLAFTAAIATATAVLFGLFPAWRATRVDPQSALKADGRAIADGQSRWRIGKALVVAQVALSLVLVVGAGLLIGTLRNLATLDAGFDRDGVLLVHADMTNAHVADDRLAVVRGDMLRRLRETPGVASASVSMLTPVSGRRWNGPVLAEGFAPASWEEGMSYFNAVSDDYFRTYGTRLVGGRDFRAADDRPGANVAIVNETFARTVFHDPLPLGRTFRAQQGPGDAFAYTVIGVARDSKYGSLREKTPRVAYVPMSADRHADAQLYFGLRAAGGPPEALAPAAQRAIVETSPSISLDFISLAAQVNGSLMRERLLATLAGFFGALALLLAVIGLYGTMSYTVARRRGEIGVRIALGAGGRRVMTMVLGEVGRVLVLGVVLGALASLAATRLVSTFLYGVTATDRLTFAMSAALLAVVALAAGAVPAWRASRVNPVEALRED